MANRLLRVHVGALLAVPLLAVGTYAANASTGGTGGLRLVPGSLPGLSRATYLGAAPATQRVRVGISLQRPNSAGETALYQQMYDPSSPRYHQFLTPAQFDRMFGVPANQSAAVARWLKGGGVTINTQSPAGDYLTATGTVAQLDRLFSVHIGDYRFQNKVFFSNDRAPSVPAALPIDAVVGLDDVHQFALPPLTKPAASAGTEGILTPQDVWGVYNDPVDPAHPQSPANTAVDFGQGQTMGIFGEGETPSVVAQLRLFEQAMGFPKIPVQSVETEGAPDSAYGDNSGAIEWYLDSQASTGMSPDASQLDLYFAKSLFDADIFADFDYWANDKNGPRQMNASFGECEENPTNPVTGPLAQTPYGTELGDELEAVGEPILRQATMEGRTLFASSGDTGSGCPELVVPVAGAGNGLAVQPVPMVSYPCVSAYAVCVGGTVVSVNGSTYPQSAQRSSETSWTFGGGGTSYFIPEPKFQHGVANVNHMCISTPSGTPYPSPPTCRGVPDVADLSGNVTGDGYFIYIDGEPSSEGGTSLSSPLMMGQWTRVQAAAPVNVQKKGGLGFADETIYRQALSRSYARDFYDVTQSEYGVGNGAYQPGKGWDYTSGWGALNVA
ncbi:MAG TPA: S53 family peptidase, partial [Acidimicrobiales bacterium]|nr:S53 family peptidase [Acidimicrobiales bacterium]